ncbi:ATP-binding cassette domain-containing protein [Metabacillus sediminilitoris]|uniref:ATP-binding cassette domain-containing protein n=1 Tax=Metabacillus sediminilitoris TaxID=2567941 RepID=A0A4S4C2T9_9BACI|nr:ATP-binding cassette domain-containing protein [Metabacillus sediminilitoris]THF82026.1 ATP-binding cassette domain-containing protein [Metabacillus sediminilitoris]
MLEIKNLKKTINGNYVLKDINLKLTHGEIFGLLSRNGSGKTTLLRCKQFNKLMKAIFCLKMFQLSNIRLLKENVIFMPVQNSFYDRYTYKH